MLYDAATLHAYHPPNRCGSSEVTELMTINWQEVIVTVFTTIGGGAVLLGAGAYLIKTALTQRLLLDAEGFKSQLKASSDAEIERLKVSLQMSALEHEVRFSKLHEKRADVIAELHRQLVELSMLAHQYATEERGFFSGDGGFFGTTTFKPMGEPDSPSDLLGKEKAIAHSHEVAEKANQKSGELRRFLAFHKIYLPADIDDLFGEFWRAAQANFTNLAHESRRDKRAYEFDAFQNAIYKAEVALEREFRKLLGDKETSSGSNLEPKSLK